MSVVLQKPPHGVRLPADFDLEQHLSFGRELVDHRTGGVRRPDVSLRVEPNRVRHGVHPFAPRPHDFAVAIQHDDGIRLVASLQQVNQSVA